MSQLNLSFQGSEESMRIIFLVLIVLCITSCASTPSTDCANKIQGLTCKSLGEVNDMVNRGEIRAGNAPKEQGVALSKPEPQVENFNSYPFSLVMSGEPLRYGETVLRVWIAPFEDTAGNYHDQSLVYTVVKKGHWLGNPVIETTEDN